MFVRFLVSGLVLIFFLRTSSAQDDSFVICYNPNVPVKELARYDIIVVDYAFPPAGVAALTKQKKTVLGYLSLGKVHKARPYVGEMQKLKIGLVQDRAYPDSFRVDVTDPNWKKLITESIAPGMKKVGFSGLFLDDLDDLGVRKLEKEAADLIAAIRKAQPSMRLMANRGLEYLSTFAENIDYSLLESCFLLNEKLRPEADPAWALDKLATGKKANPKLIGFAVDYYTKKGGFPLTKAQKELIDAARSLHKMSELRSCLTTEDLQFMPPPKSPNLKK